MRNTNEQSLKEVIDQLIDSYRIRGKMNEVRVRNIWEQLMGPAIANRTESITIRETSLHIKVSSAPLREELMFQREKIKDLMNKELGGKYIAEVVLH
ncbi:MAG TPA: DUF721 domain-containing protein [Bacteroidia bacterium]|nr:DUF721 domain-containing protein [Bacteroidia bacterium]